MRLEAVRDNEKVKRDTEDDKKSNSELEKRYKTEEPEVRIGGWGRGEVD